jgi:hypothetical protein
VRTYANRNELSNECVIGQGAQPADKNNKNGCEQQCLVHKEKSKPRSGRHMKKELRVTEQREEKRITAGAG